MKSWEIISESGIKALTLNERDVPVPGFGEVLIDVRASSINFRDLMTIEDPLTRGVKFPFRPNSDCAGEVIGVGQGVDRACLGKKVMGCFFQS